MRRAIGIVIRLAVLWCLWWVLAAVGVHIAVPRLLETNPGEVQASFAGVGGFPARFALDFGEVALRDPRAGVEWTAPDLHIESRAWNPVHFDVVLPAQHLLRLGAEQITLQSKVNRTEIALRPGPALTFAGLSLVLNDATARSNRGWDASLSGASAEIWPASDGAENAFDLNLDIRDLKPTRAVLQEIDPSGQQPDTIAHFALDGVVAFDAPWNRYTLEGPHPQPRSITLRAAALDWGELTLSAAGELDIGPDGIPEGAIRLRTEDWRKLLAFAVESGLVSPEDLGTIETALTVLSVGGEALETPLTFQAGFMAIGPVPLGPAPAIRIP
jgi:hypothetical protein